VSFCAIEGAIDSVILMIVGGADEVALPRTVGTKEVSLDTLGGGVNETGAEAGSRVGRASPGGKLGDMLESNGVLDASLP
jgi:hypothetical protein